MSLIKVPHQKYFTSWFIDICSQIFKDIWNILQLRLHYFTSKMLNIINSMGN